MIFGWVLIILSIFVTATTLLAASGRIESNGLLGIRTAATRRDERAWRRAHQAAAWLLVPGCVAAAIVGLLLITDAIGGSSDTAGEIALFAFLVLVVIAAFLANRAARSAHVHGAGS